MRHVVMMIVLIATFPSPARSATCASQPVEARGEQSRFEWLAKAKAKANWRAKVRRTSGLGAKYSVWSRAENTEEKCLKGPAGTVCFFAGTPCAP